MREWPHTALRLLAGIPIGSTKYSTADWRCSCLMLWSATLLRPGQMCATTIKKRIREAQAGRTTVYLGIVYLAPNFTRSFEGFLCPPDCSPL